MAGGLCETVSMFVLVVMLLVASFSGTASKGSSLGSMSLRVRLAAHAAVTGGPPAALQGTARLDAAAERFDAALAAWLPVQSAALATIDEVAAGRRRPESLAAVRTVVAYVCPNGLGNKLPGEDPLLFSTVVRHAACRESVM